MSYHLRPDESTRSGLRRVARRELRRARKALRAHNPPSDEAIHEARKSAKKVRAIVELIEADNGSGVGRSQKRLRTINRALSPARDSDAMVEILAKLKSRNPHLFSEHTFARARRRLTSSKEEALRAAQHDEAWAVVDRELGKLQASAKGWRSAHRQFKTFAAGIHRTYRRGRKAMARARKRQGAADFHEWRKQIKALWYQVRLLQGCNASIRRDVDALRSAETWLGDDHNLVVLCAELTRDDSICHGPVDVDRFRLAADRFQRDLRKRAIARLRRLYARSADDYVGRVRRGWKAWRRCDEKGRRGRARRTA